MSRFRMNDSSGYCFAPSSKVLKADGSRVSIEGLQKGDLVWTPSGPSTVLAIVECGRYSYAHTMCNIDGICVSPWYPFRRKGGGWLRPIDMFERYDCILTKVYAIALDNYHCIDINGLEFPTLGHGFEEPVVEHRYFGSKRVIEGLKNMPGWDTGRPVFVNLTVNYDRVTGEINGWFDLV